MDINTAAIIISSIIIVFLLLRKTKSADDKALVEWLKSTNTRLDEQTRQMAQTAKSIGEFSEIGRSMKDLQSFLASPKLRGGLGEQVLKTLLEESLPKQSFNLQYGFRSGVKVDAAIKTASGIIPIDSKFPLENFKRMCEDKTYEKDFQRDVKDRIDEISKKYILPDEGTVDFALMYVPSEAVYYEIVNSNLMDYAYKQRVMPVSPSTFYAFLRSVLLSFEGQKIASEIKTIQQALRAIHTETSKFAEVLSTLQTHINNSYATMSKVSSQFLSLSTKVDSVQKFKEADEKSLLE
ncbi:DNA recombination protein RmuC [Patescibacteria group bacterium]|nr:DNA recombination protein RmuC [Patescibacteria group bacterium]